MNVLRHIIIKALAVTSCLCFVMVCKAQNQLQPGDSSVMVLPDSSNFIIASLLISSPGNPIYSVFGHCAIRMQCPAHHLDYVYSQATNPDVSNFFRFITGKDEIAVLAIPVETYLEEFKNDGRGVLQYDLNLTHHEKQKLWQLLDKSLLQSDDHHFDLLTENCLNMSMVMIEQSLIDEQLDAAPLPEQLTWENGRLLRYYCRQAPWAEFIFVTFCGSACDGYERLERKLSPELVATVLQNASFVSSDGYRRPVLIGDSLELLPTLASRSKTAMTPNVTFGVLLLLVLIVTFLEWQKGCYRLAHVIDVTLFVFQTVVGILLAYTTFVSSLYGTHWNWYLIPFCPLAIVLWLLLLKHRRNLYYFFSVVLFIFILLTPISSQIDLPHQLLVVTFLVRIVSNNLKLM